MKHSVPVGFRKRTLKTARLVTRAGLGLARRNLGKAGTTSSDEGEAVARATRMVQQLDGLKGLVMKFGQMASYLDHSLPPAAQRVLAKLQSQSEPMDPGAVVAIIRDELGAEPGELFDSFEPVPFAAASIGQVHRASRNGRELAVKVQYPGVTEALDSDLTTVGRFARVGLLFSALDGKSLVDELRDRVIDECDYRKEADNQMLFHRLLAGDGQRRVPAVIRELSGRTVLTSEFAPGRRFQDFVDTASAEARARAGEIIFSTCFGSIFRHCVFNADPHPGNYLFDDGGAVTFLDFGCLKWFTPEFVATWKRLALCLIDGDRNSFPELLSATGMVAKPRRFDWDFQWEAMRYLYRPFTNPEPTIYTGDFVDQVNARLLFDNPNKLRLTMPKDWLFVNRLQFGLISVLAHLAAPGNWAELFRQAVEAPIEPLGDNRP